MYIYIDSQYRRKKYGTKFYNLLACKITEMNIAWVYLIVDKKDTVAIKFLNKLIDKYEFKIILGNKIIFRDIFIID